MGDAERRALGRDLGGGAGAGGRGGRLQQPYPADEPAHQPRRRALAGAHLERLWQPSACHRCRAYCVARQRPRDRARLRPQAELRWRRWGGRRRRCGGIQRPGGAERAAARRSRSQHPSAGRGLGEFSDHRPLRAPDQLHLSAGQFRRRNGDAGRQSERPMVFPVRRGCGRAGGGGRCGRARRFPD